MLVDTEGRWAEEDDLGRSAPIEAVDCRTDEEDLGRSAPMEAVGCRTDEEDLGRSAPMYVVEQDDARPSIPGAPKTFLLMDIGRVLYSGCSPW